MIQRRQFLGSAAAFCASLSLSRFADAAEVSTDLKWQCEIIETVPTARELRRPVVTGVSLQPHGRLLAIVGDDHCVSIYNTAERTFENHLKAHTDWVRTSRFSPNGSQLATAGNDRTLQIWNSSDWSEPAITRRHPEAIIHAAFSPDGSKLATVGFERTARVYNLSDGQVANQLTCACADNHAVSFSTDGSKLAAGGRCGTIRVWDLLSNQMTGEYKVHRNRIRSIEFMTDGRIVSAGDDQLVKITDPDNLALGIAFPRHASKLYAVQLLPGGLLATAGSDNQIHVWQLSDQTEIGCLKGHTGTISCLDYSGNRLVSGSYDTHVRVWRTDQYTSAPERRQTQFQTGWNPTLK